MTAETKKLFYEYLKNCKGTNHPNESECRYIIDKLEQMNISQVIFDFGISTLRCILEYFEEQENYEYCSIIRDKLKIHNRLTGENLKLK